GGFGTRARSTARTARRSTSTKGDRSTAAFSKADRPTGDASRGSGMLRPPCGARRFACLPRRRGGQAAVRFGPRPMGSYGSAMKPIFRSLAERLHGFRAVDSIADALYKAVYAVVPNRSAQKDLLAGTWLGHPLHPVLTDVTVGSWTGAFLLDVFGNESTEGAADALIGLGAL